jgi:hypothetical protein
MASRLEPLAPVINAYCWGVMRLMTLTGPVYEFSQAPEIIWDTEILMRATRGMQAALEGKDPLGDLQPARV